MAKNLVTTYNPEDATSYIGFFKSLKRIYDINEERCVPVIVINVYDDDEKKGLIEVRPVIQNTYKSTDNVLVYQDRASFMVRPLKIAQGGCALNMPIHIGDTGWVIAGDRDAKDAIESNSEINVKDKEEGELEECTYPPTSFEILKCKLGFFIPSGWFTEISDDEEIAKSFSLIAFGEDGIIESSMGLKKGAEAFIKSKNGILADTRNEKKEYGDFSIFANVDIEGDTFNVDAETTVEKDLTVLGDVDIGKDDHAKLKDTKTVVYNDDDGEFHEWTGKIVRTDGEFGAVFHSGGGESNSFHLSLKIENGVAKISKGAVQIGGFTRFFSGGQVSIPSIGRSLICIEVDLSSDSTSVVSIDDEEALKTSQNDMSKYIFPIYLIANGKLEIDYRPMPNAGCWEVVHP